MTNIEYNENKTRATFNGRLYYLRESQGYYYSPRKDGSGLDMLHRMVYIHYNGEIPKGYHIHHIDGDKSNNDISNLQCIKGTEHAKYHGNNLTEEQIEASRKRMQEIVRPKADIWHGTDEGREWHKQHYEQMKDKLHEKVEAVCIVCGKKYMTTRKENAKCCSNACRAKDRRMSGLDDEVRVCEYCGKEFTINKYRKTRFCSKKCTMAVRKKEETRVCLYCGKEFTVKPSQKKVCCSRKCASNYFAKPMTEEQRQKLSIAKTGKKLSEETKKKISETKKQRAKEKIINEAQNI